MANDIVGAHEANGNVPRSDPHRNGFQGSIGAHELFSSEVRNQLNYTDLYTILQITKTTYLHVNEIYTFCFPNIFKLFQSIYANVTMRPINLS